MRDHFNLSSCRNWRIIDLIWRAVGGREILFDDGADGFNRRSSGSFFSKLSNEDEKKMRKNKLSMQKSISDKRRILYLVFSLRNVFEISY